MVPLQEGLAASQTALLLELPLRIIKNKDKSTSSGHSQKTIRICKSYYLDQILSHLSPDNQLSFHSSSTYTVLISTSKLYKWTEVSCLSSRCGSVEIAFMITIITKLYLRNVASIFKQKANDNRGNGLSFKEPCLSKAQSDDLRVKQTLVCKGKENKCWERTGTEYKMLGRTTRNSLKNYIQYSWGSWPNNKAMHGRWAHTLLCSQS